MTITAKKTPALTCTALRDHLARARAERSATALTLAEAQRSAAAAYATGNAKAEPVSKLRAEIVSLDDVIVGLEQLAACAEHRELSTEIERRALAHATELEHVRELKLAWTSHSSVGIEANEENQVRWAAYRNANDAYNAETAVITELERRRDQLAAQYPEAIAAEAAQ